jgi:osmoprotectant transport system permease protein
MSAKVYALAQMQSSTPYQKYSAQCSHFMRDLLILSLTGLLCSAGYAADSLKIGSKRFTESYILAQVIAQQAAPHTPTQVLQGLGNTAIVYEALRSGSIDLYAEYEGTINLEILKNTAPVPLAQLKAQLAPLGLGVDISFGFNACDAGG